MRIHKIKGYTLNDIIPGVNATYIINFEGLESFSIFQTLKSTSINRYKLVKKLGKHWRRVI